jgi:hypothetical protein
MTTIPRRDTYLPDLFTDLLYDGALEGRHGIYLDGLVG